MHFDVCAAGDGRIPNAFRVNFELRRRGKGEEAGLSGLDWHVQIETPGAAAPAVTIPVTRADGTGQEAPKVRSCSLIDSVAYDGVSSFAGCIGIE